MESDKFIAVCESATGQIAIIDMSAGNTINRQKISAEAAIMNPLSKVIALKGNVLMMRRYRAVQSFVYCAPHSYATIHCIPPHTSHTPLSLSPNLTAGQVLQIFNLELRAKMKSYNMPAAVIYWRWISPNMIALVTATAVFHWSVGGEDAPVKMFDRNPGITDGTQIINYQVSDDMKWSLLCGISQGSAPGVINGTMQLYSVEKAVSQMLQGHSGVFSVIPVAGRDDAQILCFEDKKPDQPAKLFIMEGGREKTAPGGVFRVSPQPIPVAPDAANDFPVTMNASKKHGMIYMISKMGYLYLFDIFTGKHIYRP